MNVNALRQLYSLCSAIPSREFSLNLFYMQHDGCVKGCGLGYAAAFNLCGLHLENDFQLPQFDDPVTGTEYRGMSAAVKVFDITNQQALDLFSGAGRSSYDPPAAFDGSYPGTHKTLWMNRMERFFAERNLLLDGDEETALELNRILTTAKKVSDHA